MRSCPNNTYELDTGNECQPCPAQACPRFCELKDGDYLSYKNLEAVRDCEILNGNLIIVEALGQVPSELLDEAELRGALWRLRVITGFLQVQSQRFENLGFLKSLETIRARTLL